MWEQVTKEEFDKFISQYPNKLEIDVCAIGEPPHKNYLDFTLNKLAYECIVAYVSLEEAWGNENEYYIIK